MLCIYIHVPFCKTLCPYCAFYKLKLNTENEKRYLSALTTEIAYYKEITCSPVKAIFFGGGTPSILSISTLLTILDTMHHTFSIHPDCEITLEANPEHLTKKYIKHLEASPVNRISVGVQSFVDKELQFLGRTHRENTLIRHLGNLAESKINNTNLDLIFSLPISTLHSLEYSLNKVTQFNPTHISTYALSIENNTPFQKRKYKGLASSEETAHFEHIISYLDAYQYKHYEVSAFAKENKKCIHNMNYWTYGDFLGFGPSAHSFFKGKHACNAASLAEYLQTPYPAYLQTKTVLNESDQIKEYVVSHLRLIDGLSLDHFSSRFNVDFKAHFKAQLPSLLNEKLLHLSEHGRLKTTRKGLLLLNEILLEFV